jgi:lipopolysaccharide export system protein LptC
MQARTRRTFERKEAMSSFAVSGAEPWEPRRVLSLRQARNRSRLIAGLRRFFVAAAGASLASVFVFLTLFAIQGGYSANLYGASEPLRMLNPRFTGRTEAGGAFQVTAEAALRPQGEGQTLDLTSPVYRSEEGTIVIAPHGSYDETQGKVVLDGEVLFSDPTGNRFSTPDMYVDMANGKVTGRGGVTGAGPLGVVRADNYEIDQASRSLVLSGGVRGQIPDRRGGAQ